MFELEELKRYSTNVLYEFKKTLKKELKEYDKFGNTTMYQITLKNINNINHILELRDETNDK